MDDKLVEVTVGTRRYRLRGPDAELLEALASRVDDTLGAIAGPGGNKDDFRVAVLAALNLAGEHEEQRSAWHDAARRIAGDAREAEDALTRLSAVL